MRIKDAYIVTVDFNGDVASDVQGISVFTTIEEVREIVRQALIDMTNHTSIYDTWINAAYGDIIGKEEILDEFIEFGGDYFGDWIIQILKTTN